MRSELMSLVAMLLLGGCYAAHARSEPGADAGPPADVAASGADTTPSASANACDLPSETLEVPPGSCVTHTFADTTGNACGLGAGRAARTVRVVRPPSGREWYFLIRSRDRAATRIAAGHLDPDTCGCRFSSSAEGGDLTAHGVGGDLGTHADELDLVLDGDDRAMWIRLCDGPPR